MKALLLLAAALLPKAEIASVAANGNGCPLKEPVQATLADGGETLVLAMPALAAGGGKRFDRKQCSVIVAIKHDAGWQLSPSEFGARLDPSAKGTKGELTYRFHYQGEKETGSTTQAVGSTEDVTIKADEKLSPCGDRTTLVQSIGLVVKDGSTVKLAPGAKTKLTWKKCR